MSMTKDAIAHIEENAIAVSAQQGDKAPDFPLRLLPSGMSIESLEPFMEERNQFRATMKTRSIDDFVKYFEEYDGNNCFIDAEDMSGLEEEFLAEPSLGLEAGDSGLDIVIPMLASAGQYLKDNGIIIIEVGNSASALQKLFPQVPFTWLEFEYGGDGVFLLDAIQVRKYHQLFSEKC